MLPLFLKIFILLWSFTGVVYGVQMTIPNPVINVTVGQSATLPIAYTLTQPNTGNLVITWDFREINSQNTVPIYGFQNNKEYIVPKYQNRVTAYNTTGNATITISNMQPQDTGIYTCTVSNFPGTPAIGHVQLIVQVPPSTPHCSIQGNVAIEHAVKLICISEQGVPRPTYTWHRVLNGNLKPVNATQQNGLLVIGNMTKFEDGYYQCTASNSLGSVSCQLDLNTGGDAGIIVAGIIAAVLLALIIGVVVWIVIARKKSKKKHLKSSELKTGQSAAEEPARENLVVSEPPEPREYQDVPENVAAASVEAEDPAV